MGWPIRRAYTPTENNTPDTDTHTHTTRTTPQTNTSHTHLTTLEGGATTVRATSHAWVGGLAEVSMRGRVEVRRGLGRARVRRASAGPLCSIQLEASHGHAVRANPPIVAQSRYYNLAGSLANAGSVLRVSLYKILFHFNAFLWESIILLLLPPPAKPTLWQYYCTTIAQYTLLPPTLSFYAIHHTIFVIAISCKG